MARLLAIITLLAGLIAFPAVAQESVSVRAGVHPSYSRLVFDWNSKPAYTVSQSGNEIILTFQKSGTLDLSGVAGRDLPNILEAKIKGQSDNSVSVAITIPPGSRHRHLAVDDRIILDVFNPGGEKELAAVSDVQPVQPAPAPAPAKVPQPQTLTKPSPEQKSEAKADKAPAAAEADSPPPVVQIEQLAPPKIDPHVIALSSTRAFGMAVFQRGGWLWLVLDDPEVGVPPKLTGPQEKSFGAFTRFDIPGGLAYRMKLPEGLQVYGEGGGLVWRIVLTPFERKRTPIDYEREFDEADRVRGASLLWPVPSARKILTLKDPAIGDTLHAITTETSENYSETPYTYTELERLPAAVGTAMVARVDDLEVSKLGEKVLITRAGGLILGRPKDYKSGELQEKVDEAAALLQEEQEPELTRIYNFDAWQLGGLQALDQNQTLLMSGLQDKNETEQISDLLVLAKLNLANRRYHEALGFLRLTLEKLPDMNTVPEFIALRAVAAALSGRVEDAIVDFNRPEIKDIGEIAYWKSFTLAGLEDWQQALEVMPRLTKTLEAYPPQIQIPLVLVLAEVALRGAEIDFAEKLLDMIAPAVGEGQEHDKAALNYLMGEAKRQRGQVQAARDLWAPLTKGADDLYRAKAGLALTRLESEDKKITPEQAIDRLEGLRYAWRGDQLETLINYRLGLAYIDNAEYIKGLGILRDATSLSPGTKLGVEITEAMTKIFRDIFANKTIDTISPLDAIALYDEFKELTPAGAQGDKVAEQLADRLAAADLLGRATDILQVLVTRRLSGEEKVNVAKKLAAIQLLDDKPQGTLRTLEIAEAELQSLNSTTGQDFSARHKKEITLLKARALSENKETSAALTLLGTIPQGKDELKLKADITWKEARWEDAAEALQELIYTEDISLNRPVSDYQAELILSRAVALNLSGNRVALTNLRERYGEVMKPTQKAKLFDVITRPRQTGLGGGRESLQAAIGEVNLFGEFLESYKSRTGGAGVSN